MSYIKTVTIISKKQIMRYVIGTFDPVGRHCVSHTYTHTWFIYVCHLITVKSTRREYYKCQYCRECNCNLRNVRLSQCDDHNDNILLIEIAIDGRYPKMLHNCLVLELIIFIIFFKQFEIMIIGYFLDLFIRTDQAIKTEHLNLNYLLSHQVHHLVVIINASFINFQHYYNVFNKVNTLW